MSAPWTRRSILKAAGAVALMPLLPNASSAVPVKLAGPTMGTRYRVHMENPPKGLRVAELKHVIERVLKTTDRLMSTHRSDSELSGFNASESVSWQRVSAPTARVVETALHVQRASGGAFNPATAPMVDHWGFGAVRKVYRPPGAVPDGILDSVRQAAIELEPGRMRKGHAHAALDLNAIAKGDALDQVVSVLEREGVHDYLVEIGGEIVARGPGPRGDGWRAGIEHPRGGVHCVVELQGQAVATSGDYVDFYMHNGRRYSHIIDPRAGRPVEQELGLVSVIADTAMEADAWATALLVMGLEEGVSFAENHAMAALFLRRDGSGYRELTTPAFERFRVTYT